MNKLYKLGFGGSVDIASRVSGSTDALKNLGIDSEIKEINKTRIGTPAEPAPDLQTQKADKYTTSGALMNPKVASLEPAPGYGMASSQSTSCSTCKAYNTEEESMGVCTKYDFYPRDDYTCDNWTTKHGAPKKHL